MVEVGGTVHPDPAGIAARRRLRRRRVAAERSRPAADAVAQPHPGRQVHLGGQGAAAADHRGPTRPRESRAGPLGGLGADRARVGVGHRGLPALPAARLGAPARPAHHLRPRRQRPRRDDRCAQRDGGTVRLRRTPTSRSGPRRCRGAGPGPASTWVEVDDRPCRRATGRRGQRRWPPSAQAARRHAAGHRLHGPHPRRRRDVALRGRDRAAGRVRGRTRRSRGSRSSPVRSRRPGEPGSPWSR